MLHCLLESAAANCCGACMEARAIADIMAASGDAADVWKPEEEKMTVGPRSGQQDPPSRLVDQEIVRADWSALARVLLPGIDQVDERSTSSSTTGRSMSHFHRTSSVAGSLAPSFAACRSASSCNAGGCCAMCSAAACGEGSWHHHSASRPRYQLQACYGLARLAVHEVARAQVRGQPAARRDEAAGFGRPRWKQGQS